MGEKNVESLVLFAKPPVLGKVKTRLAHTLGEADALNVYAALLKDSLSLMSQWLQRETQGPQRARVYLSEAGDTQETLWDGLETYLQRGKDLGERMENCFAQEWDEGAHKVVLIGADAPMLPFYFLRQAFDALNWHDLVLGPAFDGGYWLVGAKEKTPPIFKDIQWSSSKVMEETMQKLKGSDVDATLLPFWYDVDDIDDVRRVKWHSEMLQKQNVEQAQHLFRTVAQLPFEFR